jgi:hypothetical protein
MGKRDSWESDKKGEAMGVKWKDSERHRGKVT